MWKIKKTLLEDTIQISNNYLPKEFMCFLDGDLKTQTVKEIVMLPTYNGETFSSINLNTVPIDPEIIGSLHSHPNGIARPSKADINFFQRFNINIIIGINNNIAFFDNKANEIPVKIID